MSSGSEARAQAGRLGIYVEGLEKTMGELNGERPGSSRGDLLGGLMSICEEEALDRGCNIWG